MDKKYEEVMKLFIEALQSGGLTDSSNEIPVGISNRHIHLSQADQDALFGPGYEMTRIKDLSQPGQFACREMVTVAGPKGAIEKVRVLGPVRKATQIEVLAGDSFKLGVAGMPRMSGDLAGTKGVTIIGPKGSVQTDEGLIVAQRHIHMLPEDAARLGVKDGDVVEIKIEGPRGGTLSNVAIRANSTSKLECHLDTEEANALGLSSSSTVTIVK